MTNWQRSLISFVFLFIMLAFGYQQTLAPAARTDSDLDYAALSGHVSVIAAKPHTMGSAANREVRDYIVDYFESLGLDTEVQKTTVVYRHPFRPTDATIIGNVENIIARLPGTSSAEGANDLVLMGHYDSRPDGPGAGDDASGTAAIMEVARIMVAGPAPVHDVVFLITDGEEMGLLGAQGFYRQHPAAKDVGLVLDFEARGSYGASSMFETSENNAWLIDNLIESAPDLVASSLSYEIYQRMPNDTDMSISKGEGIPGLNFAFVAGLFDYHSPTDTPENLDPDTLAQQANYVLGTAQHFANLEKWESASGDKTYFNLWQGRLVSYSQDVAVVVGLLVLALGLWVFVATMRAGTIKWGSLGAGFLSLIVLIILVSNVFESLIDYQQTTASGITRLVSLGEWPLLAYFVTTLGITVWFGSAIKRGLSNAEMFVPVLVVALLSLLSGRPWFGAIILLVLLVALMWFIRGRKSAPDIWGAALLVWWLLTALLLYFAPNASYLLVWPLASVLLGITLQRSLGLVANGAGRLFGLLAVSAIPLLLLTPVIVLAYLALGSTLPQGIMMISALSLLLLWPLVRNIGSGANGKAGLLLLGVGLVMTLVVLFDRDFDARHPLGEAFYYAIDVDQQEGFWVTARVEPDTWLGKFMGKDAIEADFNRILPGFDQDILIRKTALPVFESATMEITSDRVTDTGREINFHLHSPAAAEYINLLFSNDAGISDVAVNGFLVEVPAGQAEGDTEAVSAMKEKDKTREDEWWRWRWYGLPEEGADILLTFESDRSLDIRIVEIDYNSLGDMPEGAPQRPENSMRKIYTWSDSTVIFQTLTLD